MLRLRTYSGSQLHKIHNPKPNPQPPSLKEKALGSPLERWEGGLGSPLLGGEGLGERSICITLKCKPL
jgi:hypothetical protein